MAEILPIGTILAVAINQVIKTAHAANDIVIEKESFKILSSHLFDILNVLKELELQKLNESPIARKALENLETDVQKANTLVEKYKNRGRFYLLIKCRHIVKEVQDVTRNIGKSLNNLCLANTELLSGISDEITRLQDTMQRAEFATCHSHVQILDKLNEGLANQKLDQVFANDIIADIATAVGVVVEPSEIRKELDSFKREKEEAENRKERAEVYFLEQIIELLSRADAARDYEHSKDQYLQRLRVIEGHDPKSESIQPFKAFICGITKQVMVDPVSLSNGTAYSRVAIEKWFGSGEKTDPSTGEELEDLSFWSNIQLRQSIEECKELNYCMRIRVCRFRLLEGNDDLVIDALFWIRELMKENVINKDWISISGVTELLVSILGNLRNTLVKTDVMVTLKDVVDGHSLLAKWLWKFKKEQDSFATKLISALHVKETRWQTFPEKANRSGVWRNITKVVAELGKDKINLLECMEKEASRGDKTVFWWEDWLGNGVLKEMFPLLYKIEKEKQYLVKNRIKQ